MNYKSLLLMAGSLAALTACSHDDLENPQFQPEQELHGIVMTADNYQITQATRSGYVIDTNFARFKWNETDEVGVFPLAKPTTDGTQPIDGDQVYFPIGDATVDGTKASFDGGGWALRPQYTYAAYSPFIPLFKMNKRELRLSYEGQTYTGLQEIDGQQFLDFGGYDFMMSQAVEAVGNDLHFNFKHAGAMIILDLPLLEAGTLNQVTLLSQTPGEELFTTQATMDLTQTLADEQSPVIVPTAKADRMTIKVENATPTTSPEELVRIYFQMAPTALKDRVLDVEYTYTKAEGQQVSARTRLYIITDIAAGQGYSMVAQSNIAGQYHLTKPGTLSALAGTQRTEKMTISGKMNGDDFAFLRSCGAMAPTPQSSRTAVETLTKLDLSDAEIVEGGTPATVANTLTKGLFDGIALTELNLPKSLTTINEDAFEGFAAATTCTLTIDEKHLEKITLSQDKLFFNVGKASFNDIMLRQADGTLQNIMGIDPEKHILAPRIVGAITPERIDRAMNGSGRLKVIGKINGTDFIAIRERAGSVSEIDDWGDIVTAPAPEDIKLFHLDFSEVVFVHEDDVYYFEKPGLTINYGYFTAYKKNTLMDFAFCNSKLKSIVLPTATEITTIGEGAFQNCKDLTEIEFPSNISKINERAFQGSGLKTVTLPQTITEVEKMTFLECESLETLNWSAACPVIPYYCFSDCMALTTLTIPEGVTTLKDYGNCGLTTMVLPSTMTLIEWLHRELKSLTVKAPYSADFQINTGNCQAWGCKLILDKSWTAYTDTETNSWQDQQWLSITFDGGVAVPRIFLFSEETTVSPKGGAQSFLFEIKAATDAQPTVVVDEGAQWITDATINYQDGQYTVNYNVAEYTAEQDRSAKITVRYAGAADAVHTVTQTGSHDPKIHFFDQAEASVEARNGSHSFVFTVSDPTDAQPTVEIDPNAAWITHAEISYEYGSGTVSYTVAENPDKQERQGQITVKYTGATDAIFVVKQQARPNPSIVLNPQTAVIEAQRGKYPFAFTIDYPTSAQPTVEVEQGATWITDVQINYQDGKGAVNYTTEANSTDEDRTATITVKYAEAADATYTVTQLTANRQQSASFDNDAVLVGIPETDFTQGITYEMLVNPTVIGNETTLIGQEGCFIMRTRANGEIEVCVGNLSKDGNNSVEQKLVSSGKIATKQWAHLAATLSPSGEGVKVEIYINGKLDLSNVFTDVKMPKLGGKGKQLPDDQHNYGAKHGIYLGKLLNYRWGERPLEGMLREVRVWSKVRTQSEIAGNMLTTTPSADMVAYYKFDGTGVTGSVVSDVSGKGNNGTLTGELTWTQHNPILLP